MLGLAGSKENSENRLSIRHIREKQLHKDAVDLCTLLLNTSSEPYPRRD